MRWGNGDCSHLLPVGLTVVSTIQPFAAETRGDGDRVSPVSGVYVHLAIWRLNVPLKGHTIQMIYFGRANR